MDIHRCRFVPYNPQAINALAFSHPPSADVKGRGVPTLRLAVGRANGDIEIWNPLRGSWWQESILRGGKDRSIEALVWTLDPSEDGAGDIKTPGKLRLFSIGYSSVVTEWDLAQGRPARHSSGNYGEIWCLAAQPRWKPTRRANDGKPLGPAEGEYTGQHIAVGCADGSIVILSTEDGDLRYLRTMRPSTKRSRVLSITFQHRNIAVAGYADSSIRVFDIRNGNILRTISLGKGPAKGSKDLLVWSVKCLPDGTIVSGDSAGEIRFWDAKNFSLVQRLQSHLADVLDIAVSGDGKSVVSGGADQRTVLYRLKGNEKSSKALRWAEVTHRRYHTHDVKALAAYETKDISIVVSGGLDTVPVVLPLREYGKEHHRKLSSLPQKPQLSSSPSSRIVMSWWDREVNFWRLPRSAVSDAELLDDQHKLVGKVLVQGEENLSAAALSPDGKLLVVATVAQVKAFTIKQRKEDPYAALGINKLEVPSALSRHGAKAIAISPDSRWLCLVRPNNDIYMARITDDAESESGPRLSPKVAKIRRTPRQTRLEKLHHGSLGAYDRTVHSIAFSGDSSIVACGDLSGAIDAWVLTSSPRSNKAVNGRESDSDQDSSSDEDDATGFDGQTWQRPSRESPLPRLKSGVLLMSFRPTIAPPSSSTKDDRVVVLTADHQLSEFSVLSGKLSDWSRRNPTAYLPADFTTIKDRAMGCLWDVANNHDRLWLYGSTWLWMFDLSQDFPAIHDGSQPLQNDDALQTYTSNKRKRDSGMHEGPRLTTNSGAGDRMHPSEPGVVLGNKMRKVEGSNVSEGEWIELKRTRNPTDGDAEDDGYGEDGTTTMAANDSTLAKLRREQNLEATDAHHDSSDDEAKTNGGTTVSSKSKRQVAYAVVIDNDHPEGSHGEQAQLAPSHHKSQGASEPKATPAAPSRRWWHTFKYREVLGMVPLGDSSMSGLEAVVVERPMWDVDLPGRYIRDYE